MFPVTEFSFPYQLKVSPRAKRLSLKVTPQNGVQVVKPKRVSERDALAFLQRHVAWVEKHAAIWQAHAAPMQLPETIVFPALNRRWQICYEINPLIKRAQYIESADAQLIYVGKDDDKIKVRLLRQWAIKQGTQCLTSRLLARSHDMKLTFSQVSFRSQKTRWGSCSREKNISLNHKLIFLSAELIDYILVHELAHLQHLNHGPRFWCLVEKFVPNYKNCIKQLRQADAAIPRWF